MVQLSAEIKSSLEQKFETVLVEKIDKFIEFINSITDLREAFPDYDENTMILNTENARKICKGINNLIDKNFQSNELISFEFLFPGLIEELNNSIMQLEPIVQIEQSKERFKPLVNDKKITRLLKSTKIIGYRLHHLLFKSVNYILIKINKNPYEIKIWSQKIPLRNLAFHFFRNRLLDSLSAIYEDIIKALSKKSISFWNYDEKYDTEFISSFVERNNEKEASETYENPESIISDLESLKNEINKSVHLAIENCIKDFEYACERVGTIELNRSRFNEYRINKHFNNAKKEINKVIREWDNTLYALGEDWELNYDLHSVRYSAIEVFFKFEKSLLIKNKLKVYPQFKEISGAFNYAIEKLNEPTSELQELERAVAYAKENIQKVLLSSVLPNLINSISDLRLPEMIDEASAEINNQINTLNDKRAFVKTIDYDKKIKSSDIDEINPREIVSFNALPKLIESFIGIKESNIIELKNIQSELINLGNMSDFSLESAITAASTENLSISEIKEMAVEGINVSLEKRENLLNSFNDVINNDLSSVRRAIAEYNEEMYSFTKSSKIIEIRLQLTKAKTKAKAKETRDRFYSSVKNFVPVIFERIRSYYKKGSSFYADTRKQFGFIEAKEPITSEISDFLSQINSSVEKLPYIYRRLFQVAPLENDRLYIPREVEESQLEFAFDNWLKGSYSPVIISAEKGGGITTFLNIFFKKFENKNIVNRRSIKPSVCNQQDLLKLFGEMFRLEKFMNVGELIDYLNLEENRQVIVIENLQHMYLRSVKGFTCLNILTDVISKTSKNIFWITSNTLYANEYLNKTIRLNDIFGYHLTLKNFQDNQIIELIKKRNSISGYNIEYEYNPKIQRKKEFEKLSYKQKQLMLEKDFFGSVNKFSQSNVSLALLFWLQSIKEIKERKVVINVDFEISSTILSSLSPKKIFLIQSLVLHDGLKIAELAKTINYSLEETNQLVQILYNDGVLIMSDGAFLINPVLYRQCVTLLKSKNLL